MPHHRGVAGAGRPRHAGTAEQVATPVSRFTALLGARTITRRNAEGIPKIHSDLLAPNIPHREPTSG